MLCLGVAIKIPIVCVVLEGGPGTLHVSTAAGGGRGGLRGQGLLPGSAGSRHLCCVLVGSLAGRGDELCLGDRERGPTMGRAIPGGTGGTQEAPGWEG